MAENIKERLTWKEIKEKYPHLHVGLVDVKTAGNSATVGSAVVKCTSADTDYGEMILMSVRDEISMYYTTLDEDVQNCTQTGVYAT